MLRLVAVLAALGTGAWGQGFAVLEGHGGSIHDVAVSADGNHALTASFDNHVGFWDLRSGDVMWLEGHDAAVKAVTFAGPGQAASAGDDFGIELWDLSTAEPIGRLDGHSAQIKDLGVSPDGGELVSASWDGRAGLWDIETATHLRWLTGHEGGVNDAVYLDAATILTASADGTIRSWDRASGAQKRVLVRHGFAVTCLLVNRAAGWLIYGAVVGGTRVVDLASGETLADLTLERRPILDIAATGDFAQIAVGDGEGYIMVVDTAVWDIVHDFHAAKRGPIWALAYAPDGRTVLAGGIDDAAYFWPIGAKQDGPIMARTERDFLKNPATMSNGERQFQRKCSICHSLDHKGIRRAGPPLAGLFGRRAGSYPGYLYSETVAQSDIVWDETTIDALFDLGPDHYIPGTKMPMQRITSPEDRADLIAFLRDNTKG